MPPARELALRWFDGPPAEARRELPEFLDWLGGPALVHLRGRDRGRARLLSGGLHGNEPSGFRALHALLRDPPSLATDTLLLLGNVPAARLEPRFTHRTVPGEEDMNRVWCGEAVTPLRRVAREVLRRLEDWPLEAAVDLHNNSGRNPCYAVVPAGLEPLRAGLARAWTSRLFLCEGLSLGTLIEGLSGRCPAIVIECGQCGCPLADANGEAGARRWLEAESPWEPEPVDAGPLVLHRALGRVEVPPGVELAFGEDPRADLWLDPELDRHNFTLVPAGTPLARAVTPRGRLLARDLAGQDCTGSLLLHDGEHVRLARACVPTMITNRACIAKSDCLCYLAEPAG